MAKGRKRVYATPEDRHRAYRARLGVRVRKPILLANGVIRVVRRVDRSDEQRTEPKAS